MLVMWEQSCAVYIRWVPVACGVFLSVRAGLIVSNCTQSPAPVIVRKGSLYLRLPRVSLVNVKEIHSIYIVWRYYIYRLIGCEGGTTCIVWM